MKTLCIPTNNDTGLAAPISEHFGSAPFLTLVNAEGNECKVVPNLHSDHAPGNCDAAKSVTGYSVDAVLCRGLGRRAFASLEAAGIDVLVTDATDVKGAAEAFNSGRVVSMTMKQACGGGRGLGHHHH
jgi:predicted Fe-Mo cluster-binding NifX family protein